GTLPRDAPSYVIRDADLDLHAALARGELCSVLTPRQMGKSSLMVRAVVRLREENAKAVVIDLAAFGENVTPEQWYFAMLGRIGSQLNLEDELEAYWYARNSQGPLQRWLGAIREVVLVHVQAPVFLFIDDVDATRSLPFAAGEFFTGIRQLYDERAESASLSRLNFCLLGAATPAELVRDARLTPFKVGRLIELTDFTEKEAQVLLPGLRRAGRYAPELLRRVLYWTGGHPYLTQCLCEALVADGRVRKSTGVDRVCQETFLSAQARERDDNLLFVRDRMLRGGANAVELLTLYSTIRAGRIVKDDPAQPVLKELRLAGVVRVDNGYLRVRNRIYERVFDQKFIESNQPLDEAARQRVAERRGRLKALAWAVPLMLALAALAAGAWWQSRRAWTETDQLTAAANTGMRVLSNIADRVYDASANRPELHAIYAQILDGGTPFVDTMLRMDADNPAANNLKAGSLYLAIDDALRKGDKAAARSQSQECTARASALLGHSDPRLRAIAARLYATAAEAFAKLGDSSEAEANVKRAEATVQDVSRQTKPGDEFALQSISTTYNTLGAAEEALDRWDRAAQFYQHNAGSEQKLSDLYSKHGGDPKLFQEVHDALEERNRSAQIELDNHHYKEARKALEERSLSIAQTLVSWNNDPARQRTAAQKLDALRDRFDVEIKLGSLLALRSEDWAAALKYDLQALSDAQNLVQATPNLPSLQLREEAALAAARMYKLLGQDREASETYTRYIAWLRQRALAQPGSEVAAKLGFAYQEFGSFEAHHGNKSSAPADYLNALEWLSKISSTDGSVEREIASAYLKLAAVESDF
ncbi:MAG TPA: AAA-like domain-containing protein, partial [Bryobacteraceae bacterium]